MLELRLPSSALQEIERFLGATARGARLHRLQRGDETILFLKKPLQADAGLLQKILLGRPGRTERSPVLRLVVDNARPSSRARSHVENALPALLTSESSRKIARGLRGSE